MAVLQSSCSPQQFDVATMKTHCFSVFFDGNSETCWWILGQLSSVSTCYFGLLHVSCTCTWRQLTFSFQTDTAASVALWNAVQRKKKKILKPRLNASRTICRLMCKVRSQQIFEVGDKRDERKEPNFSSVSPTEKWLPNGQTQPGAVGRRAERPWKGRFHIFGGGCKSHWTASFHK